MKTNIVSWGFVGSMALVAGCGSNAQPTPAAGPPVMRSRVSTALAVPRIAAAECERELKCQNVGLSQKYSNMEHCQQVKSEVISKDFNDDADCRNGISTADLDNCVAKTTQETCEGISSVITDMERAGACGSADLCLD
jgi:hypothetical protein